MSDTKFDASLLNYQKARQCAMNGGQAHVAKIAAERNLPPQMQLMLVSVITDWPKYKPAFFEVMKSVCLDQAAPLMARALAAEHASSCFGDAEDAYDAEGSLGWSLYALECAKSLDEAEGTLLECKVRAGLIDRKLIEYDLHDQRFIVDYMIKIGSFDAPGRVKAWLESFDADEQLCWLEAVCAMDPESTAANIHYLGWCQKKLLELKGE
ncbi:MAG: hypothetical protein ABH826_03290 [Patescibacteria group bacterium]|nr:hypothetical protein [Patescibacteria group bacterium]